MTIVGELIFGGLAVFIIGGAVYVYWKVIEPNLVYLRLTSLYELFKLNEEIKKRKLTVEQLEEIGSFYVKPKEGSVLDRIDKYFDSKSKGGK